MSAAQVLNKNLSSNASSLNPRTESGREEIRNLIRSCKKLGLIHLTRKRKLRRTA